MDVIVAFSAGLLSFLSPCVLPLIPIYLSHLVGTSVAEHQSHQASMKLLLKAGFFIAGFTAVFMLLGVSVSSVSKLLTMNLEAVKQIGGVLIILLGLHTTGLLKIKALYAEKRLLSFGKVGEKTAFGSLLLGMAFAAGWTPCVGPILSSILIYAGSMDTIGKGVWLLAAYAMGLALPLILAALLVGNLSGYMKRFAVYYPIVSIVSGVIMVIIGVLVFTDNLELISGGEGLFDL